MKLKVLFTSLAENNPTPIWLITLSFLPIFLFYHFLTGSILIYKHHYPTYVLNLILTGILFLAWLIWKWVRREGLPVLGLEWGLAACVLSLTLSTLFSQNPSLSAEKLIGVLAYLAAFYFLLDLKSNPRLWQALLNAALISAGVSTLLSFTPLFHVFDTFPVAPGVIFEDPLLFLKLLPRLPDSLGMHPSVTAGFLLLIIPLTIYQLAKTENKIWQLLLGIGLAFHLILFFLTQSRGAFIGLLFLLFTYALMKRKSIFLYLSQNRWRWLLSVLLVLLALAAILFFLFYLRGFNLLERSLQGRYQAWLTALNILKNKPILGSGPGTFGINHLHFRDPIIFPNTLIHAHNLFFQLGSAVGILGFLSLSLLLYLYLRMLSRETPVLIPFKSAALPALGGLCGLLLTDFILTSPRIVLVIILYLVGMIPSPSPDGYRSSRKLLILFSFSLVVTGFGAGWVSWKIHPYQEAVQAAANENWRKSSHFLETAEERDPTHPFYQHALGYVTGQAACQAEIDGQTAIAHYQNSLQTHWGWAAEHANLALLYAREDDYVQAVEEMGKAQRYHPQYDLYHCLSGDYHLALKKEAQAVDAYAACLALNPNGQHSPYWQENAERAALLPQVLSRAETFLMSDALREEYLPTISDRNLPAHLSGFYLAAGEWTQAQGLIADHLEENPRDPLANRVYAQLLIQSGDLQQAQTILIKELEAKPRDPHLWRLIGEIHAEEGNWKMAARYLETSRKLSPSPKTSWLLGSAYAKKENWELAGDEFTRVLKDDRRTTSFAQDTAARMPLPGIRLDCMPEIKTYQDYFTPGLEVASLLADYDCPLAACTLRKLTAENPTPQEAVEMLETLPCGEDGTEKDCQQLVGNRE